MAALEAEVGVNRGDDAAPYSREELKSKFMDLCGRIWEPSQCEALLSATLGLASGKTELGQWLSLLATPASRGVSA